MEQRSALSETAGALAGGRRDAASALEEARAGATRIGAQTELALSRLGELRLARMRELRASIESRSDQIELGYARLAEGMASASQRLVSAAREADYSAPEWPRGLSKTIELKLTESRELTLRLSSETTPRR